MECRKTGALAAREAEVSSKAEVWRNPNARNSESGFIYSERRSFIDGPCIAIAARSSPSRTMRLADLLPKTMTERSRILRA